MIRPLKANRSNQSQLKSLLILMKQFQEVNGKASKNGKGYIRFVYLNSNEILPTEADHTLFFMNYTNLCNILLQTYKYQCHVTMSKLQRTLTIVSQSCEMTPSLLLSAKRILAWIHCATEQSNCSTSTRHYRCAV